jgi:putative ABC transport system ATP-binding protein
MVTHNDAIKNMADRVIRLRDGRIGEIRVKETKKKATDLDW